MIKGFNSLSDDLSVGNDVDRCVVRLIWSLSRLMYEVDQCYVMRFMNDEEKVSGLIQLIFI